MSKVCPVLTIGPTIPSIYLDKRIENDDDYGLDLYALDASISINWMSTKPAGSVVYVAFGSMANLSDKQMEELAWGLNNSNFNFLWVVRACEQSKLPKGFVQELGSKGLIVNWSPQVKVLASEAIGCFFTHSGWNSTIEALSLSVPMVAMPQWTDQPPNAKLVEDVWKVGIRVKVNEDGIVTREEVESCIREVMTGEKGKEMRNNGAKWRELAIEAVSEGGTSDKNIDEFVSKLFITEEVIILGEVHMVVIIEVVGFNTIVVVLVLIPDLLVMVFVVAMVIILYLSPLLDLIISRLLVNRRLIPILCPIFLVLLLYIAKYVMVQTTLLSSALNVMHIARIYLLLLPAYIFMIPLGKLILMLLTT
ncbi:UDP-glucosyltransferase, putative [Ricinus communis]|uniref:anthocyanidin 3-O-glucosyltransferase n=1 Tax=Ricinus communis TaxID=3988 RepID=B9SV08_RICCO|nr:UDP-glucosyltransferase, putative [Ricinus communis]